MDGPQTAVVTGPPGEEIFCDEHGRVRVKFTWDRYNPADETSSCWIRVSQAWAGTGFGNLAIPRVGQEVIVDFLNGDPDQPVVVGRTYHADNRSPGSLPGTKTQMTIRSKTYKGGGFNELMFEDATGQELLSMHAQKDMKTVVLNNRLTTVGANHAEFVEGAQLVNIQAGQNVTVHASCARNVKSMDNTLVGGNRTDLVAGVYLINSASEITLACGDAAITLTSEGNINWYCKNFNIYAAEKGEITAADTVDINMDGAKPGAIGTHFAPGDITGAVDSTFPPES